jgi:hypothetical protein
MRRHQAAKNFRSKRPIRYEHQYTPVERAYALAHAKYVLLRILDWHGALRPACVFQAVHGRGWAPYAAAHDELVASGVIMEARMRYVASGPDGLVVSGVTVGAEMRYVAAPTTVLANAIATAEAQLTAAEMERDPTMVEPVAVAQKVD